MQVMAIWAPHFADQLQWAHELRSISPSLLVVEPGGIYEKQAAFPASIQQAFEPLLATPHPFTLVISHWVWGMQPPNRAEVLRDYAVSRPRSHHLPMSTLNKFGGAQLKSTWHFACGIRNDHTDPAYAIEKIMAYEPSCPDLFDTAINRVFLTLALANAETPAARNVSVLN